MSNGLSSGSNNNRNVSVSPSGRAAVFRGPNFPMDLCELPLPTTLRSGEALVRVACCTLCGSDLSTLAGHRREPTPSILGHEIVGVVETIGDLAPLDLHGVPIKIGDRVVWSITASCHQCRQCSRGVPQKCECLKKYGHQRLDEDWLFSGGLAQFCHLIQGTSIVRLENVSVPDAVISSASCATATVACALRKAGNLVDANVMIFGAGLLGLTAVAMARHQGAQSVTICDLSPERLSLAQRFGADRVIEWDQWPGAGGGSAFDVVLEMSGNSQAVQSALAVAEVGGSVVLVGSVRPAPSIDLDPEQLVRRTLSVHGVHNYRPEDLMTAVDFLAGEAQSLPFEELVGTTFALSQVNEAVAYAQESKPIRTAVIPD